MEIFLWSSSGAIAGLIAAILLRKTSSADLATYIVLGIIGALDGGALLTLTGFSVLSMITQIDLVISVAGAIATIAISQFIRRLRPAAPAHNQHLQ
jgi:uncharacterized membrane protein YeaQ/YmgE (transglycosylase-associated protein family)